jgi:hypothetical protein
VLPPFDEHGHLPPGIHRCTVDELVVRFGAGSKEREVETKELQRFIAAAKAAGVLRIIVNGSYTTAEPAPNDVDVLFLPPPGYNEALDELQNDELVWPFLHLMPVDTEHDLTGWVTFFGTDRRGIAKGVAEVLL